MSLTTILDSLTALRFRKQIKHILHHYIRDFKSYNLTLFILLSQKNTRHLQPWLKQEKPK